MFEPIVIWDLEDDPDGNYVHIVVEHDISQDEVEEVVGDPNNSTVPSDSSGRPITFGWTSTGCYIAVVWEHVEDDPRTIKPVTAYEAPPPQKEKTMSVKRVYQKTQRTPEQLAELRAVRERYQREKPSPEAALAASGQSRLMPLGEVMLLHQILALLKQERERQHLTLAQLEDRTGIDQAALSRLENGKIANPTIDTIYRIAAAMGKTVKCYLQDLPSTSSQSPCPA